MEDSKQRIKDQILYLLKTGGNQTAAALAEQLQVTPMAIRQHLQRLKSQGWVTYLEERRPMGRPVKLWHLTQDSASRFPDSHADLMLDFLRSVEAVFGAQGLERLVIERSRRQIQHYTEQLSQRVPSHDWRQKVDAIAQLRSQEGYMAEIIVQPDALLLVENHCPIHAAAHHCQRLCSAELDVFRSVLGNAFTIERIEHIVAGDRRCAYRIQPLKRERE